MEARSLNMIENMNDFFGVSLWIFTQYWYVILIGAVLAYLIGSVNTSIIVTRIVAHTDIRTMGSGNAGFTNVLRSVGKIPAIITFVGDFLKGVLSVVIAYVLIACFIPSAGMFTAEAETFLMNYLVYFISFFCILGHTYPIFYGFKGGKGVVTTASFMLMTDGRILAVALGIFVVVFLLTKTISKCALVNAVCFPISTFLFSYFIDTPQYVPTEAGLYLTILKTFISLVIAVLVIYRHKDNIKRILKGTEKKITASKS